jgi:methylthioribose-1-phosphate isomerase
VLTHCNAGALATAGEGTALSVIFAAARKKCIVRVYVDETRPLLQGARLTAWELMKNGIETVLITDSTAGVVLQQKRVQAVIVGADRIAANGDAANKIGTYSLAVLAERHHVPFYVAAPVSTIDFAIGSGVDITIEERAPEEVTTIAGVRLAPEGVGVYAPAFDVTPNELIAAIVTEKGILSPPFNKAIASLRGQPHM